MNQRILNAWLPNWPIQRLVAAESALAEKALVLEDRDSRRGLVVAAANLAARRQGAKVGMRISELAGLVSGTDAPRRSQSEPLDWEIRPYQPDLDLDRLCDLAEQTQQFSPLVGIEPTEEVPWCRRFNNQPQGLCCDVSGIAHLFGGEAELLQQFAEWLRGLGYFAYMSIAGTLGAAWALSNWELRTRQTTALEPSEPVEPAASHGMPESQWLIAEPWQEFELLSELPIGVLRIDRETEAKLARLGVKTVTQLWQLPRDGLASRLGPHLLNRLDQALGTRPETIIALHGSPDWVFEFPLEMATLELEQLQHVLGQLCSALAKRLQASGCGALRCVSKLDRVRSTPWILQLGLYRPSADAEHLSSLLVGPLEQAFSGLEHAARPTASRKVTPSSAVQRTANRVGANHASLVDETGWVWRVSLQATLVAPIKWEQTQLFDEEHANRSGQLAQLIDTLSSRLGRAQVLEARLERDAEPERAVSYRPLTGRRRDGVQQKTVRKLNSRLATTGVEPKPSDPLRRPTRLLNPPHRLTLVQTTGDQLPSELMFDDQRLCVTTCWGPERLESGWWRGPSIRREYFRIETDCGQWWWIFRDVQNNQWYLHGLF